MSTELTVPVIDRLIELQPASLLVVEERPSGFVYLDKDKTVTLFQPPVLAPLGVDTLSGFMGLLEIGFEGFDAEGCLVHIYDYNEVHLVSTASDKYGRRQKFVVAKAPEADRKFPFNKYIPQEEFNIALRTMFVQTDELNDLVVLCGNIAKNTELRQEDDGFSQTVTAKTSTHFVKNETIKPRVTLKPFRTFLEVEQPDGEYVLRVARSETQGNQLALFEADAGRWKLTASTTVKQWLEQQIKTSAVSVINNLPVIA